MSEPNWTLERVNKMIEEREQESYMLDYKRAGALANSNEAKTSLSQDISSMANSAGGVLIYGVMEDEDKRFPKELDPIDMTIFNKEWLDRVIQTRPSITNYRIIPIEVSPGRAIFVVEVPQSHTAHQATDDRYHRRKNFETEPMKDHEIRDVMGRGTHPYIELDFVLKTDLIAAHQDVTYSLTVIARNAGNVLANFIQVEVSIPIVMCSQELQSTSDSSCMSIDYTLDNRPPEIDGAELAIRMAARPDPILPGVTRCIGNLPIDRVAWSSACFHLPIFWKIHADSAPVRSGSVQVSQLPRHP